MNWLALQRLIRGTNALVINFSSVIHQRLHGSLFKYGPRASTTIQLHWRWHHSSIVLYATVTPMY
jgi:hypothetical protein